MALHLIGEDLDDHVWYEQLVAGALADAEAFAARWAAFEEFVAAYGENAPDAD
jgi:hypothetical protein